jgi:hypothetical protein
MQDRQAKPTSLILRQEPWAVASHLRLSMWRLSIFIGDELFYFVPRKGLSGSASKSFRLMLLSAINYSLTQITHSCHQLFNFFRVITLSIRCGYGALRGVKPGSRLDHGIHGPNLARLFDLFQPDSQRGVTLLLFSIGPYAVDEYLKLISNRPPGGLSPFIYIAGFNANSQAKGLFGLGM